MTTSTASQSNEKRKTRTERRQQPEVSVVDEPAIVSPEGAGQPADEVPAALQPSEPSTTLAGDELDSAGDHPFGPEAAIDESDPSGSAGADSTGRRSWFGRRKNRAGGVAPFVYPDSRTGRWWKERDRVQALRRNGFVALRPAREKRIHRILPRTVIGISTMLLMLGVGMAFSGAAFYAYYDSRLADNERAVARFVDGFDQQFSDATGAIDRLRTETITDIRDEMAPFGDYVTEANAVIGLPSAVGPSVWLLETLDEDGELAVGAAFAVIGHEGGTALLTSYSLVEASAAVPSPGIDLIKDGRRIPAQLWSWDVDSDVALLVVDEVITPIEIAGDADQVNAVGTRLFAMSGVGGQGSAASPGVLIDHSAVGLQHTAAVGALFRGGPLVTSEGKMIGVASLDFKPLGIDGGEVRHAPDMRAVCLVVLECSRVREEVVVEVAEEELQAPESDGDPVRGGSNVDESDSAADASEETGEAQTVDETGEDGASE